MSWQIQQFIHYAQLLSLLKSCISFGQECSKFHLRSSFVIKPGCICWVPGSCLPHPQVARADWLGPAFTKASAAESAQGIHGCDKELPGTQQVKPGLLTRRPIAIWSILFSECFAHANHPNFLKSLGHQPRPQVIVTKRIGKMKYAAKLIYLHSSAKDTQLSMVRFF